MSEKYQQALQDKVKALEKERDELKAEVERLKKEVATLGEFGPLWCRRQLADKDCMIKKLKEAKR